jgi:hypothetical protein
MSQSWKPLEMFAGVATEEADKVRRNYCHSLAIQRANGKPVGTYGVEFQVVSEAYIAEAARRVAYWGARRK